MDNQQIQTLISTLMQGGLASSEGEARRMAEDMLGTTAKVQNEYSSKKDQNHMFADRIQAKEAQRTQEVPPVQEVKEIQEPVQTIQVEAPKQENKEYSTSMQNKIQELRNAALNPKPVDIQVNFQTPKTDTKILEPSFTQEEAEKAAQTNIQNEMPSVDFHIPGVDNNMTINELAQNRQEMPSSQQDNFFSQQNTTPVQEQKPQNAEFIQQEPERTQPTQETNNQNSFSNGLESGFPTDNSQQTQEQSDFLQVKEEPKQEMPEQTQEIKTETQTQESSSSTPQRNPTWTEEEKKLRDEVDLTKLFNFGNR